MSRISSRWLVTVLLSFSLQGFAANPQSTWVFDSNTPQPSSSDEPTAPTDAQEVYAVILDQVRYWNAHDIEHYMNAFWKSPDLLVVIEGEQIIGWAENLAAYQRGFPDRNEMGMITLQRVKLQRLSPDFFLELAWFTFNSTGKNAYCTDTSIFQKFLDGWKVTSSAIRFRPGLRPSGSIKLYLMADDLEPSVRSPLLRGRQ